MDGFVSLREWFEKLLHAFHAHSNTAVYHLYLDVASLVHYLLTCNWLHWGLPYVSKSGITITILLVLINDVDRVVKVVIAAGELFDLILLLVEFGLLSLVVPLEGVNLAYIW
jgi:hypothetical protein